MRKPHNFWTALENTGKAHLPKSVWFDLLGPDAVHFDHFFFVPEKHLPRTVQCPQCTRRLILSADGDDKAVGFPETPCDRCTTYHVFACADLWLWAHHEQTMLNALSVSLKLDLSTLPEAVPAHPIAFASLLCDRSRIPVFFSASSDKRVYANQARILCDSVGKRFALITATHDEETEALSKKDRYIYLAAADHLGVGPGTFAASSAAIAAFHALRPRVSTPRSRLDLKTTKNGVLIKDDYLVIEFPGRKAIDLSKHPKVRAFVKHLHERALASGNYCFRYGRAVGEFNYAHPEHAIGGTSRLQFELLSGIPHAYDILFEKLTPRSDEYRLLL